MRPELRQVFDEELQEARRLISVGDLSAAFGRLERAHILGQRSTRAHVLAHWEMLRVGWRSKDAREVRGQLVRLVGATLLSRIWIPEGNTGGANVSAFKSMPIPADLARKLVRGTTELRM
jgi:hypothetical protein